MVSCLLPPSSATLNDHYQWKLTIIIRLLLHFTLNWTWTCEWHIKVYITEETGIYMYESDICSIYKSALVHYTQTSMIVSLRLDLKRKMMMMRMLSLWTMHWNTLPDEIDSPFKVVVFIIYCSLFFFCFLARTYCWPQWKVQMDRQQWPSIYVYNTSTHPSGLVCMNMKRWDGPNDHDPHHHHHHNHHRGGK